VNRPREAPCFETLEPRLLYSADPVSAPVTALLDDAPRIELAPVQVAPASEGTNLVNLTEARRELIVVAANLPDAEGLVGDLLASRDGDFELVTLTADRDALTQIGELLAGADRPWDAVHLLTHAEPGRIDLGSSVGDRYLDDATLAARLGEIAVWGAGFTADGDLLLYGCELAGSAAGEALLSDLGGLLGVDIAASTDATGAAALGGDWTLEYVRGATAPWSTLAAAHWSFTLDTVTANRFTDIVDGNTGSIAALLANPGADGGISLREAVLAANATGATDTITLLAGTYTLNSQLVVNQHLGITGAGAGMTFIDGGGKTRLFDLTNNSLLLEKLTLQHGAAGDEGGALRIGSSANATLDSVVLRNNSALNGGAILSRGNLDATDVSFVQNAASSLGGGLHLMDGGAGLNNATFSANTSVSGGAAIFADGWLSLTSSTIAANVASAGAGGIHLGFTGSATLSNTLLAENTGGNANKALESHGFNLDTDGNAGLTQGSDLSGVVAGLDPLAAAANGLYLHTLQDSSAAVDAGGAGARAKDAAGLTRNALPDIGASENLAASRGKLYWADASGGAIVRANVDGSAQQVIVSGLNTPRGIAVDATRGFVYWTDQQARTLQRARLDGSELTTLKSALSLPTGLELDSIAGKLYFADDGSAGSEHIERIDIDGANHVNLFAFAGTPRGVALDPVAGHVYAVEAGGDRLVRVNYDGTGFTVLASGAAKGLNAPVELEIDLVNKKLYWIDSTPGNAIRRANFDGSGVETVVSALNDPVGLVLDVANGLMYWTESEDGVVGRAKLNGTAVTRFSTSSGDLREIDLYSFPYANVAPAGADATLTTHEDTPRALAALDFGFTDPDENAFAGVTLASLPGAGSLTLNGVAVTAGQFVSAAEIAAGKLVFTPAANANGANHASFTFRVRDDRGIANGGVDEDQSPNTLTFDVTPVNDAPAGADATITILEDTPRTLTAADFAFTDVEGHGFAGMVLASGPSAGSLQLNGVAVTAGQFVTAADIAAGKLVFTPATNAHGANHASFTFRVRDDGGTANGGVNQDATPNTLRFDVTQVNDAPTLTLNPALQSFVEGAAPAVLAPTLTAADPDPFITFASARVSITGGFSAGDVLEAATSPGISATYNAATGVLTLSGEATIGTYQETLRTVTFRSESDHPTASGVSRTLSWTVFDGVFDSAVQTSTVTITGVNDAPSGSDKSITILEDTARALTAADFGFSDSDGGIFSGVYISSLPTAGSLTLSGAAVTVDRFVTLTELMTNKLVFTPAPNAQGANHARFTFQVKDSGGTANGGINVDPSPNTLSFDVTALNDAPTGSDGTLTVLEDTPRTLTAADFGFSDHDGDAFAGIRVMDLAGGGTLSLGGVAVVANQVVSAADIAAGGLVFTPTAHANGSNHASFSFRVRDDGGTGIGDLNEAVASNTLGFDVTAVNDAPSGTDNAVTLFEDTPCTLAAKDFGFQDLDGNAFAGVRIGKLSAAGSLTLDGAVVSEGQFVTVAQLAKGALVFTPGANEYGAGYAGFTFRVRDDGGLANGGAELAAAANTLIFHVKPVNDAPVGGDLHMDMRTERLVLRPSQFAFSDVDGHTLAAVRIDSLPAEGLLLLDGQPLAAGTVVGVADLAAGRLVFDAGSVSSRQVVFSFSVGDGLSFAAESNRATLAFASPPANMKMMMQEMMQAMPLAPMELAAPAPAAAMASADQSAPRASTAGPSSPTAMPGASASTSQAATPTPAAAEAPSAGDLPGDSNATGFEAMTAAAFALGTAPIAELRAMDAQAVGSASAVTPVGQPADLAALDRAVGAQLVSGLKQLALDGRADIGALLAEIAEHARALDDGSGSQRALQAGSAAASISAALETPGFIETLDALREEEQLTGILERGVIGTGAVASTGMSVGYILYLLRGEFLLSGLLSSLPAWRMVDPLPVLSQLGDAEGGDDESLEELVAGNGPAELLPDAGDEALLAPVGDYA